MNFDNELKLFNKQYNKFMNVLYNDQIGGVKSIKEFYRFGSGIIFGHGAQNNNRFCIIPENMIVQPIVKSGHDANMKFLTSAYDTEDFYNLSTRATLEFMDGYEGKYFPGSLIPEVNILFKTTFPPTQEHKAFFSFTGIITTSIPERAQLFTEINTQTDEEIKIASTEFNNQSIFTNDELWDSFRPLSTVLKKISNKILEPGSRIPNAYVLQTCRSAKSNFIEDLHVTLNKRYPEYIPDTPSESGGEKDDIPILVLKRELSASNHTDFHDFLARYKEFRATKTKDTEFLLSILKKYRIDASHIDSFKEFIEYKFKAIDKDVANYNISINDFCVFQRLSQNQLDAVTAQEFLNPDIPDLLFNVMHMLDHI